MAQTIAVTDRLILRQWRAADLPLYAAINTHPEVMRYLGGRPLDRDVSDAQALGANRCWDAHGYGKLAVERRADGALLGMCGLSVEPWYPNDLEIGWRLAPEHWGQGYASEAGRAWLAVGFERLRVSRLIAVMDVPNRRSAAVARRIGMGHDHDAVLDDDGEKFEASIFALGAESWHG